MRRLSRNSIQTRCIHCNPRRLQYLCPSVSKGLCIIPAASRTRGAAPRSPRTGQGKRQIASCFLLLRRKDEVAVECYHQRLSLGSRLEKARAVNHHRGEESFMHRFFGDVAMTRGPLGYARGTRSWRVMNDEQKEFYVVLSLKFMTSI